MGIGPEAPGGRIFERNLVFLCFLVSYAASGSGFLPSTHLAAQPEAGELPFLDPAPPLEQNGRRMYAEGKISLPSPTYYAGPRHAGKMDGVHRGPKSIPSPRILGPRPAREMDGISDARFLLEPASSSSSFLLLLLLIIIILLLLLLLSLSWRCLRPCQVKSSSHICPVPALS